jgi:hypothetical protein
MTMTNEYAQPDPYPLEEEMPEVNIFQPVAPPWYVESHDLHNCIELVRNGNAVLWRILLPNGRWDWGIFAPGSSITPTHATMFAPPAGRRGLRLPGLPQYAPGSPGYPKVTSGAVLNTITGSGITFHIG